MEGERILAVFPALQAMSGMLTEKRGAGARVLDLIFTDHRVVGVTRTSMGSFLEGAALMAYRQSKMKDPPVAYDVRRLDAIVASDGRGNFSIPFARVEKARIAGVLGKTFMVKGDGREEYISLPKRVLGGVIAVAQRTMNVEVK